LLKILTKELETTNIQTRKRENALSKKGIRPERALEYIEGDPISKNPFQILNNQLPSSCNNLSKDMKGKQGIDATS